MSIVNLTEQAKQHMATMLKEHNKPAIRLGLKIDKDDSLCFGNKPFALLLHGMQEKGSKAGEALKLIKRNKKQLSKI